MKIKHPGLIAAAGFFVLLGFALEKWAEQRAVRRFHPPGQRVDLGGRSLYIRAMGKKKPGSPTVVLESGHADWSVAWRGIQPEVARFARVVAYDRAGFGWSDPGPLPRGPEQLVSDLHAVLEKSGESGPYILVGHSMGGAISRLFYLRYPDEVAGMVWVDSAHENLAQYLPFWRKAYYGFLALARLGSAISRLGVVRFAGRRLLLAAFPDIQNRREQAAIIEQVAAPKFFDVLFDETVGLMRGENWKEHPVPLGMLPVISIEAQYTPEPPNRWINREWQQYLTGWKTMQTEIGLLSERTKRVPAQTGHVVMNEQPQIVIDSIREMLETLSQTEGSENYTG